MTFDVPSEGEPIIQPAFEPVLLAPLVGQEVMLNLPDLLASPLPAKVVRVNDDGTCNLFVFSDDADAWIQGPDGAPYREHVKLVEAVPPESVDAFVAGEKASVGGKVSWCEPLAAAPKP